MENTLSENTLLENTLSENTISENTLSENTLSENTLSENTLSENTLSEKKTFGKYNFGKIQPRYQDPKLKNNLGPLSSTFHIEQPETLIEWKLESITYGPTDGQTDMAMC